MTVTDVEVQVVSTPQIDVDVQFGDGPSIDVAVQVEPPTFTVMSVLPTGPRGPAGSAGANGATGPTGADGADGDAGPQGDPGPAGADGQDGTDGDDGAQGSQGVPGATGSTGPTGPTGPPGADGDDGAPGADGSDGAPGADGANGVGVPVDGTTGQVLAKASNTDFDTEWVDQTGGSGLPPQWTDGGNGDVTATVDDLTKTPFTIEPPTGSYDEGSIPTLRVTGEDGQGLDTFVVDTYGSLTITATNESLPNQPQFFACKSQPNGPLTFFEILEHQVIIRARGDSSTDPFAVMDGNEVDMLRCTKPDDGTSVVVSSTAPGDAPLTILPFTGQTEPLLVAKDENGDTVYQVDVSGRYARFFGNGSPLANAIDPTTLVPGVEYLDTTNGARYLVILNPAGPILEWVLVGGEVDGPIDTEGVLLGNGQAFVGKSIGGVQAQISDIDAYNGSGNGIRWNGSPGAIDGEQTFSVRVGPVGSPTDLTMSSDGTVEFPRDVYFDRATHASGAIGTSAGEPADGDINAGECFRFFDSTDGAARIGYKGKTDDGTVVFAYGPMGP